MIIPDDVATKFVENWTDISLADELARQLSCQELDALATLLSEFGATDAAATWVEFHAPGDDEGDDHYQPTT